MPRISAGLLMYRIRAGALQVLLAHPGGPLFRNRDEGAWSIPKGEIGPDEDLLDTAQREFEEETGIAPREPFLDLGQIRQKSGKVIHAWAWEGDADPGSDNPERHWRAPMRGDFSKIEVVYGGFDMVRFRPSEAPEQRKAWGLAPGEYAFGMVGGYSLPRGKGQPEFLKAAARIRLDEPHARFDRHCHVGRLVGDDAVHRSQRQCHVVPSGRVRGDMPAAAPGHDRQTGALRFGEHPAHVVRRRDADQGGRGHAVEGERRQLAGLNLDRRRRAAAASVSSSAARTGETKTRMSTAIAGAKE